jgi:hypothetical protein
MKAVKENVGTPEMKYFNSRTVELNRSEIHPAAYNPRKISSDARKRLKRSIKQYGVVGGMVVNERTGNTLVSGHQKLSILDELNKYPDSDYRLKVEVIDVDEKTEKELNIFFNNANATGEFDYDALRELIPSIDYDAAGLTPEDLNIIGIDLNLQTDVQASVAAALEDIVAPIAMQKQTQKEIRAQERAALSEEEKTAHVKAMKRQITDSVQQKAEGASAYVTLSFDSFENKALFMKRFGYEPHEMFLKGEVFNEQVERID